MTSKQANCDLAKPVFTSKPDFGNQLQTLACCDGNEPRGGLRHPCSLPLLQLQSGLWGNDCLGLSKSGAVWSTPDIVTGPNYQKQRVEKKKNCRQGQAKGSSRLGSNCVCLSRLGHPQSSKLWSVMMWELSLCKPWTHSGC